MRSAFRTTSIITPISGVTTLSAAPATVSARSMACPVIVPGRDKGKSYIEHQAEQNGTSYKAKLRAAIDRLLPGCADLEDLLRRLQREGYELKRGK